MSCKCWLTAKGYLFLKLFEKGVLVFGVDIELVVVEEDWNVDNKGEGDDGEFDEDGNMDNKCDDFNAFLLILCGVTHPALLELCKVILLKLVFPSFSLSSVHGFLH